MRYLIKIDFIKLFALIIGFVVFTRCSSPTEVVTDLENEVIMPIPVSVSASGAAFKLSEKSKISVAVDDEQVMQIASTLKDKINASTGYALTITSSEESNGAGKIEFNLQDDNQLGEEGYRLKIETDNVLLTANKPAGLFYGVQTLLQLLPVQRSQIDQNQGFWVIPTGEITDYPNFGYRGSMLDVSRHFFGVDVIKKYIDYLAFYKLNVLHLHLSDDQGWRIEIKSWPNLTNHGGKTEVGGGDGGFFTQEQYSEIINYAKDRFIMIIPEIDMPGHTNAALSSYPELNCDGKAPELYTGIEVGFSTLCTDKEITYQFVDDVVKELAELTPGPFIHIGGDESHATAKEDYIPFINKVQDIVNSHGKQMVGWDEVATATLKENSVAQYWASEENAKLAAEQNVKVIVSPAKKTYLDMQYDSTTRIGLHWAAYIELDSAYNWEPTKLVDALDETNILGIESPLWTETVENMEDLEYLVFPRLIGHAEIGWSPASRRDWESYKIRLAKHASTLDAMGINYYKSALIPW